MCINQHSRTTFFFFGLHHYECVAPLVTNSLQSCRFWARSTASVHDSPWESRSFCTVFIQDIRGRPGGLFQYTEGEEVKICFASTLSSIRAICPNRVRRRAWIISVSRGWLDNLDKVKPEYQTILNFTAARDDGSGSGANKNQKTCKAPIRSSPPTTIPILSVFLQARCSYISHPINGVKVLKAYY